MSARRMFAMVVWQRDNPALFDIRGVVPTLEEGKELFEREWRQAAKPELEWEDAFGGTCTNRFRELVYEVRPVDVRGLADEAQYTRVQIALGVARQAQLINGHDWDVADAMQVLQDLGVVATA